MELLHVLIGFIFIIAANSNNLPFGRLQGTRCDLEAVRSANSFHLHSILSELSNTTFFRLARVDLTDSNNPICEQFEDKQELLCGKKKNQFDFKNKSKFPQTDDDHSCNVESNNESNQKSSEIEFVITNEEDLAQNEFYSNSCKDEIPSNFWHDLCKSDSTTTFVNLAVNPERNTGYKGSAIWKAIYEQNCLSKNDHGDKCLEELVLNRLLSGWHASVSTHIAKEYSFKNGKWVSNIEKFMELVGNYPERIENIHFTFVVLLRALFKAKNSLGNFSFKIGHNEKVDEMTVKLMNHLIDSSVMSLCAPVFYAFDETQLFSYSNALSNKKALAIQFKKIFKNITKIVGCVKCQRCKLHAKVFIHGIGTALKILLTNSENYDWLSRDDIVALVNTLFQLSESLDYTQHFLYNLNVGKENENKKKTENKSNLSDVEIAIKLISELSNSKSSLINKEFEGELIREVFLGNEKLITLAKYFNGENFVQHAKNLLEKNDTKENNNVNNEYDAIIVGGGLAGLAATIAAADRGARILLLDKMPRVGGNSAKASSGINFSPPDDRNLFLNDTLLSASDAGNHKLSEIIVKESYDTINWFTNRTGIIWEEIPGLLGGHSNARTMRPKKGLTGAEIIASALGVIKRLPNVIIKTNTTVIELLIENQNIRGVKTLTGEVFKSNSVILATGGFGFSSIDNKLLPEIRGDLLSFPTTLGSHTTGDGIQMGLNIGADTIDMEYIQLHPTGFIDPKNRKSTTKTLCAELLRGVGGLILNKFGHRFVNELGTRKEVVDAMLNERKISNEEDSFWIILSEEMGKKASIHVKMYESMGLLTKLNLVEISDKLGISKDNFITEINNYNDKPDNFSKSLKPSTPIDTSENSFFYIGEIVPVIHYTMGGLKIDEYGRVLKSKKVSGSDSVKENDNSNKDLIIPGLYAIGEVSGGTHGKNRLGGNSLLECTVFGRIVGNHIPINNRNSNKLLNENKTEENNNKLFTIDEVAKHNNENDCYVILFGNVFNMSGYSKEHPGGEESILKICGKDGTDQFETVHSRELLENSGFEKIGKINTIN